MAKNYIYHSSTDYGETLCHSPNLAGVADHLITILNSDSKEKFEHILKEAGPAAALDWYELDGNDNLEDSMVDSFSWDEIEVPDDNRALLDACKGMLDRYVGLVNSGDAGNWDPEVEPTVIACRAAIALAEKE